jgi:excisionase family DNA binding protein
MQFKILTTKELLKFLHISQPLLYKLIANRKFPSHRVGNKRIFILSEIETWLKKQKDPYKKKSGRPKKGKKRRGFTPPADPSAPSFQKSPGRPRKKKSTEPHRGPGRPRKVKPETSQSGPPVPPEPPAPAPVPTPAPDERPENENK